MVSDVPITSTGPDYFMKHYPDLKVDIEDCEGGEGMNNYKRITVLQFFLDFGRSVDPTKIWKLKVCLCRLDSLMEVVLNGYHEDWPPKKLFRSQFEDLFHAFMSALPVPDLCRYDGVLNFASHFPRASIMPDLGTLMPLHPAGNGLTSQYRT